MIRVTALLVATVMAGAQASAITCGVVCAASALLSRVADGCHIEADDAAGLRVTPVSTLCHDEAVGYWVSGAGRSATKSVMAATVLIADPVRTNAPPTDSTGSVRRSPESPPPLGSLRPSILRI